MFTFLPNRRTVEEEAPFDNFMEHCPKIPDLRKWIEKNGSLNITVPPNGIILGTEKIFFRYVDHPENPKFKQAAHCFIFYAFRTEPVAMRWEEYEMQGSEFKKVQYVAICLDGKKNEWVIRKTDVKWRVTYDNAFSNRIVGLYISLRTEKDFRRIYVADPSLKK